MRIGITGANAIAAAEGAILFIHNEGNILELMMRCQRHLILAGIDKVYPNLEEVINMARLLTFYATGAPITSFMNIIAGPSATADIEKRLLQGIHGPEVISLILLDNGRRQISGSDFRELLYCIGCGDCLLQCPAYQVHGERFSKEHGLGGRGLVYSAVSKGVKADKEKGLDYCLTCRRCARHCPVGIDVPTLVRKLRTEYGVKIPEPHLEAGYQFIQSHVRLFFGALRLEILALLATMLRLEDTR